MTEKQELSKRREPCWDNVKRMGEKNYEIFNCNSLL